MISTLINLQQYISKGKLNTWDGLAYTLINL